MLVLRGGLIQLIEIKSVHCLSPGGDGGPLMMELEVENVSGVSVNDAVTREIPSQLNIAATGGATIEDSVLTWDVGHQFG